VVRSTVRPDETVYRVGRKYHHSTTTLTLPRRQQIRNMSAIILLVLKNELQWVLAGAVLSLALGGNMLRGLALGAALGLVVAWMNTPPTAKMPVKGGGVVVSGASSGIGKHAALELVKLGFTVFAGVRKEKDRVALESAGCIPLMLDVTIEESVTAAAKRVREALAKKKVPLVAVVNNAGVLGSSLPIELETVDSMQWVVNCNVFGIVRMYKAFVPLLRDNCGGRIVNIGSVMGHLKMGNEGTYAMSKHAVEAITGCSRAELAKWGISVSVLEPGFVRTALFSKSKEQKSAAFETLRNKYSPEMHGLYPSVFDPKIAEKLDAKIEAVFQKCPPPSTSTTPAIIDAITSPRPQMEYIVGNLSPTGSFPTAKLGLFLFWLLPTSLTAGLTDVRKRKKRNWQADKKGS